MFVRVNHIRAPLQPCPRRGGSGCIRTRPNNRPAGRDRMHLTNHGSGSFASQSNLVTALRCLRLRLDAERRGGRLGRVCAAIPIINAIIASALPVTAKLADSALAGASGGRPGLAPGANAGACIAFVDPDLNAPEAHPMDHRSRDGSARSGREASPSRDTGELRIGRPNLHPARRHRPRRHRAPSHPHIRAVPDGPDRRSSCQPGSRAPQVRHPGRVEGERGGGDPGLLP